MDINPFRQIVWPFAVAETIVWATMYYSFPALLLEWERDLGWSKAELTGAFTLALVLSAVLAPFAGRIIDHGHGRHVFAGSTVLGAAMLCLLSQVTELWQFYLVWIGLGFAMAGSLYEACFAIVTRVFGADAKKAITLVTLVAGFAGTVSFPSAHTLVGLVGWRGAVVVFAIVMLVVATPLIWYGCRAAERLSETNAPSPSPKTSHALHVAKSFTFWALALSLAAIAVDHSMILTHLLAMLNERGVDKEAAVLAASMLGPMQVAGRLAMMAAERHVSNIAISVACFLALGAAAASLLGASAIPSLIVAFVVFQGAGYGVTSIIRPVLVAELLGRQNFGVVSGLVAVPFMAGFAAGPTVGALIWDAGGYTSVILFAVAILGLGLTLLLAAVKWSARATAS